MSDILFDILVKILFQISYLIFLGIFSFFVLTDLHSIKEPISVYEYITWGWTITMVAEEVRQVSFKSEQTI